MIFSQGVNSSGNGNLLKTKLIICEFVVGISLMFTLLGISHKENALILLSNLSPIHVNRVIKEAISRDKSRMCSASCSDI